MGSSSTSLCAKAAGAAPAQPITRRYRYTGTASTTERRRRRRQLPPVTQPPPPPALPLRRPQRPNNTHIPQITPSKTHRQPHHNEEEEEEEENHGKRCDHCSSSSSSNISTVTDVLCLMDALQLPVTADVYAALVKECTDSRDAIRGAEVHAHIQRSGTLRGRLQLANRLLLMYAACGRPDRARELFNEMPNRNPISWAAMIAALGDNGSHREALRLFVEMHGSDCGPAARWEEPGGVFITMTMAVLGSCACLREIEFGELVHGLVLKMGGCSDATRHSQRLGSSLIQLYGTLGCRESAQRVFDHMSRRDSSVWTDMVAQCCREDLFEGALEAYREMGRAGKRKTSFTFACLLRACGRMEDGGRHGRQVHADAIKIGGAESDPFVRRSLVEMYGKCGILEDARKAFDIDRMAGQIDIVCWNAMFRCYALKGQWREAIKFLYEMKAAGVEPQQRMLHEVLRMACGT